jgi:ABC-type uncharacterized transport system involved in gliding motility auxiliary subunit
MTMRRSLKYGANSALMVLLFLGILGIVNYLGFQHRLRTDLSASRTFSLAPQSVNVTKDLKREIKATGFFQEKSPVRVEFKDLMESYRYYNDKIRYEMVDPDKDPGTARRYGITQPDTVVLESGSQDVRVRNISEQEMTSAIIRVSREGKRIIYFLGGHGEHAIDDKDRSGLTDAKFGLEGQGFEADSLSLIEKPKVPSDATVLVLAGPQRPILKEEQAALGAYLKEGGQLLVMLDPQSKADLDAFLFDWGIRLKNDIVVDPVSRLFGGMYNIPVISVYYQHDITRGFNLPTFYPLARSVRSADGREKEVEYEPLIETGKTSWATADLSQKEFKFDPKRDEKGPIVLGAIVTAKNGSTVNPNGKTRIVFIGDSDFASNLYFKSVGNGDMFLNIVSWLARDPELISIRPKEAKAGSLLLAPAQGQMLFFLPVVALPVTLMAVGLVIWRRRKKL